MLFSSFSYRLFSGPLPEEPKLPINLNYMYLFVKISAIAIPDSSQVFTYFQTKSFP